MRHENNFLEIYLCIRIFTHFFLLESKDAASLFLCHRWVCSSSNFADTIISIWRKWEKGGFPVIGITHGDMITRLTNFVVQYVESPVLGNYQEEAAARSKVRKEIQKKYKNLEEILQKAKFPREIIRKTESKQTTDTENLVTGDILQEK